MEDESHFHVLVVAESFEGQPLLARHRAVQALFTDAGGQLKFHALRITAKSPAQVRSAPPASHLCSSHATRVGSVTALMYLLAVGVAGAHVPDPRYTTRSGRRRRRCRQLRDALAAMGKERRRTPASCNVSRAARAAL